MREKPLGLSLMPVSVHVLTLNSARTLEQALLSVKDCAEILLIDGGSTDETLTIGKKYGARVIAQGQTGPLQDFAAARNEGLKAMTQPWVLVLDSDEVISDELLEEIRVITKTDGPAGYLVPRRYVMEDGTVIRAATTYPNEHLYFFHRDAVEEWIKPVHERVRLKPGMPVKHLRGASLAPLPTIEEYKGKNRRYIAIEAESSRNDTVSHWFIHRFLHTLRSRAIAFVRLLGIWLIPKSGKRLPLRHEILRFWYGWQLIVATFPRQRKT